MSQTPVAAEKFTRVLRLLALIGMFGSLASLAAIFGRHYWVLDLLSHFRVQYIVLGLLVLVISLAGRAKICSLVIAVCLAVHIAETARLIFPWRLLFEQPPQAFEDSANGPEVGIRVMSSNLLVSNTDHTAHIDFISKVNPDVIMFQEYTPAWDQILSGALKDYPHQLREPAHGSFGIAAYSKLPFLNSDPSISPAFRTTGISITVMVGKQPVKIYGVHPPPPMSPAFDTERNGQLVALAEMVAALESDYIVMGDLNITPWSGHYKDFIRAGKLKDGRKGLGILATWPAPLFPLQIPIDHILVSTRVDVQWMGSSKGLSSDHHAIWADLAFAEGGPDSTKK